MRFATLVSYLSLLACTHARVLDSEARSIVNPRENDESFDSTTGIASPAAKCYAASADASYWLADIKHQGLAAFNANPSTYTVFRNVKDYGAKGVVDLMLSIAR